MTVRSREIAIIGLVFGMIVVGIGIGAVVVSPPGTPPTRTPMTATQSEFQPASSPATSPPKLAFRVLDVDQCGVVCRNVTARLTNLGSRPVTNTSAVVTIYARETAVWNNTRPIGELAPGASFESTERVTVTPEEAQRIQANNGTIRIEVVVQYDGGTETIERRRSVF